MEKKLNASTTDGLRTVESQRRSLLTFKTTSDEEDDVVFKTCASASTECTFGSPVSSSGSQTVSRRLNLGPPRNSRPRAGERNGRAGDVRGFLSTIYGPDTHRPGAEGTLIAAPEGTPIKRRHGAEGAGDKWFSSRQTALEELQAQLENRLRADVHFRPKLQERSYEERSKCGGKRGEDEIDDDDVEVVVVEEREPPGDVRRLGESFGGASPDATSPSAVVSNYTEPKTLNEPTIELLDFNGGFDETLDAVTQGTEEKKKPEERGRRAKAKWQSKELAECTFHPQVSPTSAVLFHNSSLEKGDVFCRLYPRELQEQADKSRSTKRKEELILLERKEMEALREHCGGMTAASVGDDSFRLFLHNVLGSFGDHASCYIRTDYRSPVAEKLSQETVSQSSTTAEAVVNKSVEERQHRLISFNEFLHRQDAHYRNRSCFVREVERALTPSFQPEITENSVQIAKELLARSLAKTPDPTNVSLLASAVKKHRSPYVDPCTFKPRITAVSRAMAPRGVEAMFRDGERFRNSKARAQKKALDEELKFPFSPSLNNDRNVHVESFLNPKNYARYAQCLRQRRERRSVMKSELDAMKEQQEIEHTTFRPTITRKPAYVSRMASSFALVRQQYGEL